MAADTLSAEELEFLAKCEEELKDRFTEKDEEFMKEFNAEPSKPPVLDWWIPNSHRRNDRRHNRRHQPYERPDNRERNHDRRDNRGYNDYPRDHDDAGPGYRQQQQRHRYHY